MANNEIITTTSLTIAENLTFKDKRLKAATDKIVAIYTNAIQYADAKNREFAKILSTVKTEKSYEEDGFKSVADYASKVFGFSKSKAYGLAAAGDVYNDANASQALKQFSPFNLAAIASVDRAKVEDAVKEGRISAATSQADLKEYATANAPQKSGKTEVLDMYRANVLGLLWFEDRADELKDFFSGEMTLPEWDEDVPKALYMHVGGEWEVVKLPKAVPILPNGEKGTKATINRRVYFSRNSSPVYVEFEKVSAKPAKLSGAKSKEDMLKLLQSMDAAEIEEMLNAVNAAKAK